MIQQKKERKQITLEEAKKHIRVGQPTKYNPKEHPELLIEIFGGGEGIAAFCSEAMITQVTFATWRAIHPEFQDAYLKALNMGQRRWERMALSKDLDKKVWLAIMRNRFHYNKLQLAKTKTKTANDLMDAISERIEDGDLDIDDANKLGQLALTKIQVENASSGIGMDPFPREELDDKIEYLEWKKAKLLKEQEANKE